MERIFKIRIKTKPSITNQYPSERRYSASIVLGLSVIFLHLSLCAILMGGLVIHKINIINQINEEATEKELSAERIHSKLENDMKYDHESLFPYYYINVPVLVVIGCFIMAFGEMLSFLMGLKAWKNWYIDNNIMYFFLTCTFSTLTSCISLIISLFTFISAKFDHFNHFEIIGRHAFPISFPLGVNITVLSIGGIIWSLLAAKVSYRGMMNSYPDDDQTIATSKNDNHISKIPVEIINNFTIGNMIEYYPKRNNDGPTVISCNEYNAKIKEEN